MVLASQSYEQLRAVFDAYSRIANKDIEQAIQSEMSGDLATGMLTIGEESKRPDILSVNRIFICDVIGICCLKKKITFACKPILDFCLQLSSKVGCVGVMLIYNISAFNIFVTHSNLRIRHPSN